MKLSFIFITIVLPLTQAWSQDAQQLTADSIHLVNVHGLHENPDPLWLESDESFGVAFVSFPAQPGFFENLRSLDLVLQTADRADAQSQDGFSVVMAGRLLGRIDQVQRDQVLRISLDPNGLASGDSVDFILVPSGPDGTALRPQAHLEAHYGVADAQNMGLVAEYLFNGNYQDSSGAGHHGTTSGPCQLVEDRFGKAQSALRIGGQKDAMVTVAHDAALNFEQLTLSVWVTGDSPRLWARILHKFNHRKKLGYALFYCHTDKTLAFESFGQQDTHLWCATDQKLSNTWQHVVFTYDGQQACFYIDGELDKRVSSEITIKPTDEDLVLGNGFDGNHYFPWNGSIDDVRIYNRALSEGEVRVLYIEKPDKPIQRIDHKDASAKLVISSSDIGGGNFLNPKAKFTVTPSGTDLSHIDFVAIGSNGQEQIVHTCDCQSDQPCKVTFKYSRFDTKHLSIRLYDKEGNLVAEEKQRVE